MDKKRFNTIFLDRDGVINVDTGYISHFSEIEFIPDTIKTLKKYTDEKINLFVITNQSGLARGYFDWKQYTLLNIELLKALKNFGINIIEIFTCPHHPDGSIKKYKKICDCRKPKPGLILMACEKYNLEITECILVGDNLSDVEAGKAAGINECYILSNKKKKELGESVYNISSLEQLDVYQNKSLKNSKA